MISKYTQGKVKKNGGVPEDIFMLSIMETYHWTYEQYMNTPSWVIELIAEKNKIDAKYNKLKSK